MRQDERVGDVEKEIFDGCTNWLIEPGENMVLYVWVGEQKGYVCGAKDGWLGQERTWSYVWVGEQTGYVYDTKDGWLGEDKIRVCQEWK